MALSDGVKQRAVMLADHRARLVDNAAERLSTKLGQQEFLDAYLADKANALTILFLSCCQPELFSQLTYLGFFVLANWHQ